MPVQQTTQRWITNPDGSKTRGEISEGNGTVARYEPGEVEWPTPRTHAEADTQAEERGLEFPDDVTTVKAKAEFLAQS